MGIQEDIAFMLSPRRRAEARRNSPTQESEMTLPSREQRASGANELETWWRAMADEEIMRTVPKAVEYGSHDLVEIGRQLVLAGVTKPSFPSRYEEEAYYAELGIHFYLVGKFARWTSAIREGEPVSDDTLLDLGIYVRMAQRVREAGSWPGLHNGPIDTTQYTVDDRVIREDDLPGDILSKEW